MTEPIREQLLGYLLELLEPEERAAVEQLLAERPELMRELEALREELFPLHFDDGDYEPPSDLAASTLDLIVSRPTDQAAVSDAATALPVEEVPGTDPRQRWRWPDLLVMAASAIAALMLVAPAIQIARTQSQLWGCQANLRQIGIALHTYSQSHRDFFPPIPAEGPLAVAGSFAPTLVEGGFLGESERLICPSSPLTADLQPAVSFVKLQHASPEHWPSLQRQLSGSYGYTLGRWDGDNYTPVRNQGRANFGLVADAPSLHLEGLRSANHGGKGQNVLMEDGHVKYFQTTAPAEVPDGIFLNRCGYVGPGLDPSDTVIGQSGVRPRQGPPCP